MSGCLRSESRTKAVPDLKAAIKVCFEKEDHVSREMLEHILVSEEEHVDWLEEQFDRIKRVGVQNYLQEMMLEESS